MNDRREYYRKPLNTLGHAIAEGRQYPFRLQDLSLDGFQARFDSDPELEMGCLLRINIPGLNLEGWATLTRLEALEDGQYLAGLQFDSPTLRSTSWPLPPREESSLQGFDGINLPGDDL
jgi:hypothetical protein